MDGFISWSGYFPLLVFLCIGLCGHTFLYAYDHQLILKWIAENTKYLVEKKNISHPWFAARGYARLIATDSASGKMVEIKLRLRATFVAGVRLDKAVCESISVIDA